MAVTANNLSGIDSEYGRLVLIRHRNGDELRVRECDLSKGRGNLIPLFERNGKKRTRANAWLGSGAPSDVAIGDFEVITS